MGNDARLHELIMTGLRKELSDPSIRHIAEPERFEYLRSQYPLDENTAPIHESIDKLEADYNERIERVVAETDPGIVADRLASKWYGGPKPEHKAWQRYKEALHANPGMREALDKIDRESTDIVRLLADPNNVSNSRWTKRGLVLGHVQSGKTANYAAVIAKAVGAGYRFVIVLAGMHTNLRMQTQRRLDRDLSVDQPPTENPNSTWDRLTRVDIDSFGREVDIDFQRTDARDVASHLRRASDGHVLLAVVKKNATVLRYLRDFLKDASQTDLDKAPILIIDDESDNATPDTNDVDSDPSTINRLLREIWEYVRTGTYVAYTATPFANLLMDPNSEKGNEELYPSDFIYSLSEPDGYMGARRYFGAEYEDPEINLLREIPEDEVAEIVPSRKSQLAPTMVPSLREAINWYFVATAIRRARGHKGHSSMLIHLSMLVDQHEGLGHEIANFLSEQQERLSGDRENLMKELEDVFTKETTDSCGGVELKDGLVWQEIAPFIPETIQVSELAIDNSQSDMRLSYPTTYGRNLIVVGGNTLSRGLTIEHLVCSYFARTSTAYDTLMQMGRWFGFRPGYEDLVRVWLGPGLAEDFQFLSQIELELRGEIADMQHDGIAPGDAGVRIRSHPGRLNITARNKRRYSNDVAISLQNRVLQTHRFSLDAETIKHNQDVVGDLIYKLRKQLASPEKITPGDTNSARVFRGVESRDLIPFFEKFLVAPSLKSIQPNLTVGWLEEFGSTFKWNVVLTSPRGRGVYTFDDDLKVRLTERSRFGDIQEGIASVKSLVAPSELLLDLPPDVRREVSNTTGGVKATRKKLSEPTGILLLYMIDKDSSPNSRQRKHGHRHPLRAPDHVPAFGAFIPEIPSLVNDYHYVAVDPEIQFENDLAGEF